MPTFTDRATRTLKLQKAERPKIGNGLPPMMDGFEGENRIQMVNGNPRLYYRANNSWYFTGLSQDGTTPDIPTATSTRLGLIKIGSGGTVSSDGTYTATAATPAADDITGGDAASTFSTSSGAVTIGPGGSDSDVLIKGNDGGASITALTFDMSAAGAATFNNNVTVGALLIMPDVTSTKILVADGTSYQEIAISGDATLANDGALSIAAAQTNITSIYATDLIMGEDSQTAIDFGTANEIDFKADNAARLTLSASVLYPVTNNQIDLGTSTLEFKDAFFDGTVTSDAFAGPLTGNVTGDVSGNAGTVTVATRSTDADHYILFSSATSGSLALYDNAALKYNPSSGVFTTANMTISTTLTVNGLTASDNLDIGTYGFTAAELYADNRGAGKLAMYTTGGQLHQDLNCSLGATLTATAFSGPLTGNVTGNLSGTVLTATQGTINHDSLANFVTNEHINWVNASAGTIHASNYTDTVDMGDGFKIADADSNVDVVEGEYVKFTTQSGSGGVGVVTGAGTSGDPHLVTLNYNDTNTVDMGDGFIMEDDSGDELAITENKEVKFIGGTGITTNWTDTSHGTDGDPYDLSFILAQTLQDISALSVTNSNFIVGDGSNFVLENASTARTSLGLGTAATRADSFFKESDDVESVALGGTGASSLNNLITMGTHTTGNYVATITGGTGITSTAGTSGESTTHTLSVDAAQTQITSLGTIASFRSTGIDDNADATALTLGSDESATFVGTITANNGYVYYGTGGEYIYSNNTHLWMVSTDDLNLNSAGNTTIDSGADIILDAEGADVVLKDGGTQYGALTNTSGNLIIKSGSTTMLTGSGANATFAGTLNATSDVVAYYSSDPTLKENKELILNPLDKIDSIGGYSFDWKESAEEYGKHLKGHDYGVMADEIQSIFPELVDVRDNGIRAVKYDKLVPLLIEGIKELKRELNMIKGVS
jgi:hypothetical protein